MGDIARLSLRNEELLYQLFGVNAELLIDHAWGWEPCTMDLVKAYRPETNSLSSGQVLSSPYDTQKAEVVVREMAESMALELLDRHLVSDQVVLTVGYDAENLTNPAIRASYHGDITTDHYGRKVPRHAQGTANLDDPTCSARILTEATVGLFHRIVNPLLLVRRLTLTANHVVGEQAAKPKPKPQQLDLFTDYEAVERKRQEEQQALDRERRLMEATLLLKKRYGKNALLKGTNFEEGATQRERNNQIGGHKA